MTVRTRVAVRMSYPSDDEAGNGSRPPESELSPGSMVDRMIGTMTKNAQNP